MVLDQGYAQSCADSADAWAKQQRRAAGYSDGDGEPGPNVIFGTTMYGVALYRERGAADGYPSYEDLSTVPSTGAQRRILQLLGIPRPGGDWIVPVATVQ